MKLVLLSGNYPFGTAGDNAFIQNEIEALANNFEEVVVISTDCGDLREDIPNNVRAISLPVNKSNVFKLIKAGFSLFTKRAINAFKELKIFYNNITFLQQLKQIVKYEYMYQNLKKVLVKECKDADIVYSYWMSSRAYSVAKLMHKNIINPKFITRVHGFDCYLLETSKLPYRDYIIESLDKIVFISNTGKRYYEEVILPKVEHKCDLEVAYLGVNKQSEYYENSSQDKLNIVTCSTINENKRLDIVVDALSQIDNINISWVHFGDGPQKNTIISRAQEKLSNKINIKYKFMGNVNNKDLMDYYRNNGVDLFINSSDSEGIPVSIMEAYSFGIPAMARNIGGISEIICGNNEGYLLDSNAGAEKFAQAIENFANLSKEDKDLRRKEVIKIFESNFSKDAIENYIVKLKEF